MYSERKKKQIIRLIFVEFIMVISMLFLVVFFVFWAMGYKINKEGKIEQNGLVHLISNPNNAEILVDGKKDGFKVDASKITKVGLREFTVKKNGYEEWKKNIEVKPGILSQIYYVRLFPTEKKIDDVREIDEPMVFSLSNDKNKILYTGSDVKFWRVIDLKNPIIKNDVVYNLENKLKKYLDENKKLKYRIEKVIWNRDNNGVFIQFSGDNLNDWIFISFRNLEDSLDISEKFAMNFTEIRLDNDNSDRVWAVENNNLREINLKELKISGVINNNVEDFSVNKNKIAYVKKHKQDTDIKLNKDDCNRSVFIYNINEKKSKKINCIKSDSVKVVYWEYYGDEYLLINYNGVFKYRVGKNFGEENEHIISEIKEKKVNFNLDELKLSDNGQLIIFRGKNKTAVFDIDSGNMHNHVYRDSGMIDGFLMWRIKNNELVVYDFDDTNQHIIGQSEGIFATVSNDNKSLYYIAKNDNKKLVLRRLELIK